jgi:antitoxin HicB
MTTEPCPIYIALIHKDANSCYGVSFPDWPGVFTAGDTIDEAMQQAAEVLEVAAEDRQHPNGSKAIPSPRTIVNCGLTRNFKKTRPTQ